jgi:ABC-type glycerol-3-phosphate transport system substrate-binding protein
MKKGFLLLGASLAVVLVCGTCGGGGSSSASFDLFTTAEKATPVVIPVTTTSVSVNATWSMGNTLYEIFQLIREYNNDRDNGKIDGSNMHKVLYDANTYVAQALNGCLTTEQLWRTTRSQNKQ